MWFSNKNTAQVLTQELVERTWDLAGRLKHLESTLDERLEDLSKRYRRAEQSEKRLDDKKASTPCEDEEKARRPRGYLGARQARLDSLNRRIREKA